MPYPRHAIIQLPTHPIRQRIHLLNHNSLILQLPPHIISLLPQIPNSPKHPIQLLILLMHKFTLPLQLHRSIVIISPILPLLFIKRGIKLRRIRQLARRRRIGYCRLQLLPHLLYFGAYIVDEFPAALDFFQLQAEAVGVLLDGADAFD